MEVSQWSGFDIYGRYFVITEEMVAAAMDDLGCDAKTTFSRLHIAFTYRAMPVSCRCWPAS